MKATLGETTRDLGTQRGFSGGLRKAFDGLVFDGWSRRTLWRRSVKDVAHGLQQRVKACDWIISIRWVTAGASIH
jgi:hypothetical protein